MIRIILSAIILLGMGLFYLWLVDNYRFGCVICWVTYPLIVVFLAWVVETGLNKVKKDVDF